jgi:hypothetical protein
MSPLIVSRSTVRIVPARTPHRGEIWAFCLPDGSIVMHRLVAARPDGRWVFRSMAYGVDDPPVSDDHLIGRAVQLRGGGRHRHLGRREALWWLLRAAGRTARRKIGTICRR